MGVDRAQVASWLWMKADDVVEESLAALPSRKLYVIPGWKYRVVRGARNETPDGASPPHGSQLPAHEIADVAAL